MFNGFNDNNEYTKMVIINQNVTFKYKYNLIFVVYFHVKYK